MPIPSIIQKLRIEQTSFEDMRSGPSPNARHMRESKIESEEYLGPHDHDLKLRVGDVQKMQFEDKNHLGQEQRGPLLWSEEQRQNRISVIEGKTLVDKNKEDMKTDLANRQMFTAGTAKQLKERCLAAGISLQKEVDHVAVQGFIGIAKGMYEILWERGFIDPNVEKYTIDGIKDPNTGQLLKETSLKHLIQQLPDLRTRRPCCIIMERNLGASSSTRRSAHLKLPGKILNMIGVYQSYGIGPKISS